MKGVIDEDLPRSFRAVIKFLGLEVFDVRDIGLRGKSDEDIFNFAVKNKAVLFSADLGFSNILSFPLGSHNGIVILRFPNEIPVEAANEISKKLLSKFSEEDFDGNLIIISPRGIRIRRHR